MRAFPWVVVAVVAGSAGCNRNAPPAPGGGSSNEPAPVKVKVAAPKTQPLNWVIEQPGTVEPLEITPVFAKLQGHVKTIAEDRAAVKAGVKLPGNQPPLINIGSEVEAGQPLATLSIPELDRELAEKKAAVTRAAAERKLATQELAVASAQIATAEAGVKEAEAGTVRAEADVARWKVDLDQINAQIAAGLADTQTRTVATKNWEAAKAARLEAEAKVAAARAAVAERVARKDRAGADIEVAAARVKVAEAAVREVRARRTHLTIPAPFAGIVTARNVHHQRLVDPAAGPLFVVARVDVLRVFVDVPEAAADKSGPGAAAVVRVPALAGREYTASVTRTTRVVNPESHTLRVEIDLENPDRVLKPGAYVVVQIQATTADAVVIPSGCVLAADETYSVFLVEGGRAVKYRVQLGRSDGGNVQVLGKRKATLTAGVWDRFGGTEQVVNGNLGALTDGGAVEVE